MCWPEGAQETRGDSDVRRRAAVARPGPRGDHSDRGKQRRASSGPLIVDEVVVYLLKVSEGEMGCGGGQYGRRGSKGTDFQLSS